MLAVMLAVKKCFRVALSRAESQLAAGPAAPESPGFPVDRKSSQSDD